MTGGLQYTPCAFSSAVYSLHAWAHVLGLVRKADMVEEALSVTLLMCPGAGLPAQHRTAAQRRQLHKAASRGGSCCVTCTAPSAPAARQWIAAGSHQGSPAWPSSRQDCPHLRITAALPLHDLRVGACLTAYTRRVLLIQV